MNEISFKQENNCHMFSCFDVVCYWLCLQCIYKFKIRKFKLDLNEDFFSDFSEFEETGISKENAEGSVSIIEKPKGTRYRKRGLVLF